MIEKNIKITFSGNDSFDWVAKEDFTNLYQSIEHFFDDEVNVTSIIGKFDTEMYYKEKFWENFIKSKYMNNDTVKNYILSTIKNKYKNDDAEIEKQIRLLNNLSFDFIENNNLNFLIEYQIPLSKEINNVLIEKNIVFNKEEIKNNNELAENQKKVLLLIYNYIFGTTQNKNEEITKEYKVIAFLDIHNAFTHINYANENNVYKISSLLLKDILDKDTALMIYKRISYPLLDKDLLEYIDKKDVVENIKVKTLKCFEVYMEKYKLDKDFYNAYFSYGFDYRKQSLLPYLLKNLNTYYDEEDLVLKLNDPKLDNIYKNKLIRNFDFNKITKKENQLLVLNKIVGIVLYQEYSFKDIIEKIPLEWIKTEDFLNLNYNNDYDQIKMLHKIIPLGLNKDFFKKMVIEKKIK